MVSMQTELLSVLNILVLVGAVASAFVAVEAKRILDSVIGLGAAGSFMAVEFLFLQAPDVAIAEAAVGAVLGTVLYIIALRKVMGKDREDEN
jgi:energy-converting hydrogenase B subunit D